MIIYEDLGDVVRLVYRALMKGVLLNVTMAVFVTLKYPASAIPLDRVKGKCTMVCLLVLFMNKRCKKTKILIYSLTLLKVQKLFSRNDFHRQIKWLFGTNW